ncbi:MAG: hypothetical protein SFU25_06080 [Candidatus Caenarcaniphilales bacterium]|nr:hypothetical protein [Candidatus Caenarcaniphilales bacterium]
MQAVKKLEIIVDSLRLKQVIRALEEGGIKGYTIIDDIRGKGERGIQDGGSFMEALENSYLITTCPPEALEQIIIKLRPLLEEGGGVCFVSDAMWLMD